MRAYNFPVHTAPDDGSDRVFRLVLDPRFSAAEMLADYPRNVVQPFLDIVIAEGKQPEKREGRRPASYFFRIPESAGRGKKGKKQSAKAAESS